MYCRFCGSHRVVHKLNGVLCNNCVLFDDGRREIKYVLGQYHTLAERYVIQGIIETTEVVNERRR